MYRIGTKSYGFPAVLKSHALRIISHENSVFEYYYKEDKRTQIMLLSNISLIFNINFMDI